MILLTNQSTNKTINYYNNNASAFTSDTIAVDFDEKQNVLLKYLAPGAHNHCNSISGNILFKS